MWIYLFWSFCTTIWAIWCMPMSSVAKIVNPVLALTFSRSWGAMLARKLPDMPVIR